MNDGIVSEGILPLSDLLEVPEDVSYRHPVVVELSPRDHASEGATVTEPAIGDSAKRLVVGDEDTVQLRRTREVGGVLRSFWENIDGSQHIPSPSLETSDQVAVNVGVGIQREEAGHASSYDFVELRWLK
jgi:hypothetical protein